MHACRDYFSLRTLSTQVFSAERLNVGSPSYAIMQFMQFMHNRRPRRAQTPLAVPPQRGERHNHLEKDRHPPLSNEGTPLPTSAAPPCREIEQNDR
jgi:hypothetical protein